jgi:hypothetical protein
MVKSSTNQNSSFYYHTQNSAILFYSNNLNTISVGYTPPFSASTLKINGYRQIIQNGSRIMNLGTTINSSTATTAFSTSNYSRTLLFHQYNSGSLPYAGHMFFDMSFSNVPTTNDWDNVIYPLLRNKYGASN